jgi:hypothetical protein
LKLQVKIRADTYNRNLTFAESIWNLVDENFRISPAVGNAVAAKQAMFETELLKLVPSLTKDEIEQLRQAVAGEVNKGKLAVIAPAVAVTPAQA